jgi:alkylation response protein AidB-like acyl-CoA dehydrogenase
VVAGAVPGALFPADATIERVTEGGGRLMSEALVPGEALASVNGARLIPSLLPADRRALVDKVAALARERFAPRAAKYDAEASFPAENYRDLHEAGLLA